MSEYMKKINKVFGKKEEFPEQESYNTTKKKRELTPYEKMERERKMKEQGLDPQTGQKLKDGGIVCRTKAYKEIIKNPRKK